MASNDPISRERSLPAIPRSVDADVHACLSAMREQIERLSGKLEAQSRAIRLWELENGLLNKYIKLPLDTSVLDLPGAGGARILKAPRNLKYDHQIFCILLTWENVEEDYSHVEIWCAENSVSLDDAKKVGIATKPLAEWRYYGVSMRVNYTFWIRAVGWDGALSPWCPPQGQGGLIVPAEITKTIEEILEMMIGQITENQLYQALNERIALIDGTAPGSVSARIAEERTERISGDSALAQIVTTLQSTTNDGAALLQIHASVLDGLKAQYYVKTDVNGYMSGFGLYNTGKTSDFIVLANRFMVVTPGQSPKVPFVVGPVGTSGSYGVGIDGGLVVNGTVMTRHLDAGAVTADKIGAGQIGAKHIGAQAITTDKLAALAVTADKIAVNAITADMIKAGTLDANLIRQNGIPLDKIAAGVISNAGAGASTLSIPGGGSKTLLFVKFKSSSLGGRSIDSGFLPNVARITVNYGDGSDVMYFEGTATGSPFYFLSGSARTVTVTHELNKNLISKWNNLVPGFECNMFYITIK